MIRALPFLAMALIGLSGCASCEPLMEVRHCLDTCAASDDAVTLAWTQADAEAWPEFHALIVNAQEGEHEHQAWTSAKEQSFWDHFGVSGAEKELHVTFEDESYRLKVLSCD